jgi:hypothetical protein
MDALLLLACLLVCLLVLVTSPLVILYVIPVRSVVRFTVREHVLRKTATITWGFAGLEIADDPEGTRVSVLVGRQVLKVFVTGRKSRTAARAQETTDPARTPLFREKIARPAFRLLKPLESLGSLFWKECRFTGVKGTVRLGLGDPALTGMCYGSYWASRFVLESLRIQIEMEPVFDREIFACDIAIHMALFHPLLFIIATTRLLLNPAAGELLFQFRQEAPGAAAA